MRGWIEMEGEASRVTLASECNSAAFKDLAAQPEPGYLFQPWLLRTVRSCGDGNLFYTQKGEHSFRFALHSQADSARVGEEHNSPLLNCVVEAKPSASALLPDKLSFGRITPDHVQIAVVKKAEDGQGIVVRLVETRKTPDKTPANVRLFKPIEKAIKTTVIEENDQDLARVGEGISVPIAPLGIETLRLFLSR